MVDHNNPQSRNEEILIATIDGKEYNKLPQSRIEELLLELKEVIEAGSGGGGGIKPIGVTTTPLYDGATTNPIQINGESYTAETGDMVTYQSTEFLFNVNEVWQELGDVSVVLAIIDSIFEDIAPAFSTSSTYAVGDYVIYNDQLYKCTTAHTGAWSLLDFVATTLSDEIKNNKGTVYTAGKYININANNEISVNPVVPNEAFSYTFKQIDDNSVEIIKTVDDVVVFDEVYACWDPVAQQQHDINETFDDAINIHVYQSGERSYTLLIASDTHEAGFKQTTPWWERNTFVETFSTVDHSGEKLITKSELDSALAGKQGVLTAGNYVSITNDGTIKVTQSIGVYDVYSYEFMSIGVGTQIQLTKKINNVTISTQVIGNQDYSPTNKLIVDGLFELWYDLSNFYWHYKLLVDSNEHQKYEDINWYYTTMADYTETFNVSQDSSTDLVVRSELNAVSEKLPAVPSTDGTYILTATVTNGEPVYSWESNNGLTQEQINALTALLN